MPEPGTVVKIPTKMMYSIQLTSDDIGVINQGLVEQPWKNANPVLQKIGRQMKEQDDELQRSRARTERKKKDDAENAEKELKKTAEKEEKNKTSLIGKETGGGNKK